MQNTPWQLQPYATFPLHAITSEKRCGCGDARCTRIGKHPRVRWGALEPGTHASFFADGSGRGLVCGRGVVVIDLDVKDGKNGVMLFQALAASAQGFIPPTYAVYTGTGGMHLYYKVPDGVHTKTSQAELGVGIDVRGDGGYAAIVGSPHVSGGIYTVASDVPIADCPPWLVDLVQKRESAALVPASQVQAIDIYSQEGTRRMYLFHEACGTMPAALQGANGSGALWNVAMFGVRTLLLPFEAVYQLIWHYYNPRCNPPWTQNEIVHKIKSALERGNLPWNSIAPANWEEDLKALVKTLHKEDQPPAIVEAARAADPTGIVPRVKDPAWVYTFDPALHAHVFEGEQPDKPRAITVSDTALVLATHVSWRGVFQTDGFFDHVVAINPPCKLDAECGGVTENDITRVQIWLERAGCKVTENSVGRAVRTVASHCHVDTLGDYVRALPDVPLKEAGEVLSSFALGMLHGVSPLAETFVRKTLIGAVRRALVPGTQVDTMLVLYGDQGVGKSQAIRHLFGADWYRSQMPSLEGRDASHALQGFWGIELGELDRVLRSESSTVKEFLTRSIDTYREYGTRDKIRKARRCVFIGTTNEPDFLRGDTEYRRYWPFEIGADIDFEAIGNIRDEIWAAAKALAASGESHFIQRDVLVQAGLVRVHEQFTEHDPWEAQILAAVRDRDTVQAGEAYVLAFGQLNLHAGEKVDMRIARRVSVILRRAGWQKYSTKIDGRTWNGFSRPTPRKMAGTL